MAFFGAYLIATLAAAAVAIEYARIHGLLCIRSEFIETHAEARSDTECGVLCSDRQRCQAFSTADAPCQLFVFDKCSKYVRDCNCTRRAQVFVKQQAGLPPGALCPAGYADDFCGTKYKMFAGLAGWSTAKAAIDTEPGLVIMADVVDMPESSQILGMMLTRSLNLLMMGGRQLPGSAEPAGGWFWVGCNASISMSGSNSVWRSGEPNNDNVVNENVAAMYTISPAGMIDTTESTATNALAECVSPFG